jgi:NitT/TauT family transport system substrate-binding protein
MIPRRHFLLRSGTLFCAGAVWTGGVVQAQAVTRVSIAVPGPGNLLFLPITLARKIGADRAEGIELDIRYVGGGPQAYRDMLERNVDFSAGGLAALALQRMGGKPVVSVVALSRVPGYTLLLRSSLQGKVKSISGLAGKVVGVKGHVPGGRSTSQLFTEHVLADNGVQTDMVNYVSVGQAYENQRAALVSGSVDAIMGDEPFATRLVGEKSAFILADFHDLETTRKQMGGLFLNGNVATREDVIANRPELVGKVVRTIARTLVWISNHSNAEMVDALALSDVQERNNLLVVLAKYKSVYPPDGRISDSQVATVTRFLHATESTPAAQKFDVKTLMNTRWAGTAP